MEEKLKLKMWLWTYCQWENLKCEEIVTIFKKGHTVLAERLLFLTLNRLVSKYVHTEISSKFRHLQTNVTCEDKDFWHRRIKHTTSYSTDKVCEIHQVVL